MMLLAMLLIACACTACCGRGWRITGDTLWHAGESIGFGNVIVRWPRQHCTIVLLSNRNDPAPYQTVLALARIQRS